jgi:hypothetical protein
VLSVKSGLVFAINKSMPTWNRKKNFKSFFKLILMISILQIMLNENLFAKYKNPYAELEKSKSSKKTHHSKGKNKNHAARKMGCKNPIGSCSQSTLESMIGVFDKAFRVKNQKKGKWGTTIASVYGVQRGTATAREIDDTDNFAYKTTAVGVCMDPNHYIAAVSMKRHDPYLRSDDGKKRQPVLGSIYMVKYGNDSRLIITTDVGGMQGNKGQRDFDISPRVFQGINYETDGQLNWAHLASGKPKNEWTDLGEINERVSCVTTINNYLFDKNPSIPRDLTGILDKRRVFLNANLDFDPNELEQDETELAQGEGGNLNYMDVLNQVPAPRTRNPANTR